MDPVLLFNLISLALNTTLQLLGAQGITKQDYSKLAVTLEGAFGPLLALLPQWLKGGTAAPTATTDVLAAYATAIGVLNALKSQPGLPADMLAKIAEYISAAQDGTTAFLGAQQGFDPTNFTPVTPLA